MDIDIDFSDRNAALCHIKHIVASRLENGKLVKHNTGVYLQKTEFDPIKNMCAVPYTEAEQKGYFKIDFLNVSVYDKIESEVQLIDLMNREPIWELLEQDEFVNMLFQLNGHGAVLRQTKPKSIAQLAAVIAMIRPAKRHLIGKDWNDILQEIWVKPVTDEYYFKKSHGHAYAMAVVVQMNMLCDELLKSSELQ